MSETYSLIGPINRPEYPRNPEGPLSALAWSVTGLSHSRQPGRVFQKVTESKKAVVETRWRPDDWIPELEAAGLEFPKDIGRSTVAASLLDSIGGVRADKANAIAAVPLVPNAAFLQNPVGVHSKDGPPNFALIIEQLYALGRGEPAPSNAAATAFMKALSHKESQPVFEMLNRALRPLVTDSQFIGAPTVFADGPVGRVVSPAWLQTSPNPFRWFRSSWDLFCTPSWRDCLPRRRWSDWAGCILRTGISFSFLWEANFYKHLGRAIASNSKHAEIALDTFLKGNLPLLQWNALSGGLGTSDVNGKIIRTLVDGNNVRAFLSECASEDAHWQRESRNWSGDDGIRRFIKWARSRSWASHSDDCYGRRRDSAANNLIETVTYLLQTRQHVGADADFYGLLTRRKRRFVVIDPGLEWIVVIASIAAKTPGGTTTLRSLKQQFRQLGLSSARDVLVSELERAGLARSSHDADDAIAVQAGF